MMALDLTREGIAARHARIAELTRAGLSQAQIAAIVGITPRSVCRTRKKLGLSRPLSGLHMTPDEIARAQALLDDGASYKEVARTLGRSSWSLRNRFPGYAFTVEQSVEAYRLHKAMSRLGRGGAA